MAAIDEILIPSLILEEVLSDGSTIATPAADHQALFLGEDGLIHVKDSAGAVTDPYAVTAAEAGSIQTASVPNAEGEVQYATGTEKVGVYDGQRVRTLGAAGWTPTALPLYFVTDAAFLSTETLAAVGGSIAIPVNVNGHMLLQAVSVRNRDTATARSWEWRLYEQYLNNGNAGENTLAEVVGANGSESFTPGAVSTRVANAVSAPVYLAPGIYWLVIRNTHATSTFAVAVNAMSAEFAPRGYQTKTLGSALGSTLDLVAATWTKQSQIPCVRMTGRVFGETTAF